MGFVSSVDADRHFRDLLNLFPLQLPERSVLETSVQLSTRYSLSHWDSLLLAGCIESGVTTLYSEDLSAGGKYDSVTVINPFI